MTISSLAKAYEICGKKNRAGNPCARPAGWGTPHPGHGPCKLHGGSTPFKHGLYSKQLAHMPEISERIKELKTDPQLLDSRNHIAVLVACFEKLIETISDANTVDKQSIETVAKVVDVATKAIERHHKINVGYYVSLEKLQIIQQMLIAVIARHVQDQATITAISNDLKQLKMPE